MGLDLGLKGQFSDTFELCGTYVDERQDIIILQAPLFSQLTVARVQPDLPVPGS